MTTLISITIILLTAIGQILLKMGADRTDSDQFYNGFVVTGYIVFSITVLLSYHLMKVVPLKYFTVIMSTSYVAVMLAARIYLQEPIKRDRFIGTALIAIGVFVFLST